MRIVIVSPALPGANNGNARTASRWRRMLAPLGKVRLVQRWPDGASAEGDEVMLALHARRSAESIAAWHSLHGARGLAVVLTGTDLHCDLAVDEATRRSLGFAQALVTLHQRGVRCLPAIHRKRARILLQSATSRPALAKSPRLLRAVMVGHLRDVKSPATLFEAARLLAARTDIRIDHIGSALDPELGASARSTMAGCPGYRWLGGLPHADVRRRTQSAHVLVHASKVEGGAHAVIEAIVSGTPVLASRIDGNLGILGAGYPGTFPVGDPRALAKLLVRCRETQADPDGLLARLREAISRRALLFEPDRERRALRALVRELAAPP
ncbi:MAG TPA: selenoneine biosynthesis selenosugar synthase SenB [Myxococcales bacterium]|jgi:putative glycosyltransferase (TIGR04348 family)